MTDGLIAFLRARIGEDERVARAADGERWYLDLGSDAVVEHFQRHDAVRVLAEVDAKRRILDRWQELIDEVRDAEARSDPDAAPTATAYAYEQVAAVLALPYADRPGYRPEWAPDAG